MGQVHRAQCCDAAVRACARLGGGEGAGDESGEVVVERRQKLLGHPIPPPRLRDIFYYIDFEFMNLKPLMPEERKTVLTGLLDKMPADKPTGLNAQNASQTVDRIVAVQENAVKSLVTCAVYKDDTYWADAAGVKVVKVPNTDLTYFSPDKGAKEFGVYMNQVQVLSLRIELVDQALASNKSRPDASIEMHNESTFETEAEWKHLDSNPSLLDSISIDRLQEIKQRATLEKEEKSQLVDNSIFKISQQKMLIENRVAQQPPVDRAKLEKLKQSAEATAEMAKITEELTCSMALETAAQKELLTESTKRFKLSLESTKKLYKLAVQTNVDFTKLGGNKGTPFFSKCLGAGCKNQDIFEWYHRIGNQVNTYDTEMASYLMIYPDDSGLLKCTHCTGIHPPSYFTYSCPLHKEEYRPHQ